ncbi:MAG: hypothetical protein HQL46_01000 [Gammaproteobacteria bacterium]|nr:hypothetical protein [Gammaproteobacteria bacterium]
MEFFTIVDIKTTAEELQQLTVDKLTQYCSDIDKVLSVTDKNNADIYCIWGQFSVHRQVINGGVRFSLPNCPNALAWTITTGYEPAPNKVVIHGTINRIEHEPEFIESIEMFMGSWKIGLEENFN